MMGSSSQLQQSMEREQINSQSNKLDIRRIKNFLCPCGRSYGSYPALYSHIKRKHQGKAPGVVIKPKPQRKRGRPYKIGSQRINISNHNFMSSKYISNNFNQKKRKDHEFYPLKQLEQIGNSFQQGKFIGYLTSNNQKYINLRANLNPQLQKQYFGINNQYPQINLHSQVSSQYINPNIYPSMTNIERQDKNIPVFHKNKNIDHLSYQQGYNIHCKEQSNIYPNKSLFFKNDYQRNYSQLNQINVPPQFSNNLFQQNQLFSQNSHQKPFNIKLKLQIQSKFKPIQNGITQLLEPILQDICHNASQDNKNQFQNNNPNEIDKQISQTPKYAFQQKQINNQINQQKKSPQELRQKISYSQKNKRIKIADIIRLDFFNRIAKWMVVHPTAEDRNIDFVQYGFRWAIMDFLHYLQKFLESEQHQQVFLVLIFLSDHILYKTKDFTLRGEPKIYELALYFKSFIDEYIPRILLSINGLVEHYLFCEYRKRLNQLFLLMTCWMSMQQYYHNKYFRQMIKYQLTQQCFKAFIYQQNYSKYINEALKIHTFKVPQQQQIQQKVQENLEPRIVQSPENQQESQRVQQSQDEIISSKSENQQGHKINLNGKQNDIDFEGIKSHNSQLNIDQQIQKQKKIQ